MAKAETIKLKSVALSNGKYEYKVIEVVNRVDPKIGETLTELEVHDLCMEAKRPYSALSNVKIT
jgi:hypothetical protein